MGAKRPQRPDPGHAMLLPRVGKDAGADATQRALDAVKLATQQGATTAASLASTVASSSEGRLLAVQILTGAGPGALNALTHRVHVRMIAGGGGGGGGAASAGSAAGGGGGTGVVLEFWVDVTPGGAFTYSAPAAQASGGASTGANGANGSDASLAVPTQAGAVTYTAKGSTGGEGSPGTTADATSIGGAGQGGSTSGAGIIGSGGSMRGEDGLVKTGIGFSGMGGSLPPYGTGGTPVRPGNDGGDAIGFGAGGGGANATAVGKDGGKGAPAVIVIEEYS